MSEYETICYMVTFAGTIARVKPEYGIMPLWSQGIHHDARWDMDKACWVSGISRIPNLHGSREAAERELALAVLAGEVKR